MANPFSSLFAEKSVELANVPAFMAQAMELRAKENQEKLVKVGSALLGLVASQRDSQVKLLREYRKQEKKAAEQLKGFQRAAEYFHETGNFGPLTYYLGTHVVSSFCNQLGVDYPESQDLKVPDNWEPKSVAA